MGRVFLLADNQDITREGLASVIAASGAGAATKAVANRRELQAALKTYPDAVVVLDYTLFDFASMEQMLYIKESAKGSSWVLFSDELSISFLRYVLVEAPDISVVMKGDTKERIAKALAEAAANRPFRCDFALQSLRNSPPDEMPTDKLTATERSVLREIALGKTTKEIAAGKFLSFHTINAHRKNIFRKLGINSVHEAIRYALRAGLIDMSDYYI